MSGKSAVMSVDSASTNVGTDVDIDFEKFRKDANAADLAARRGELGTPSTEDSATSGKKPKETTATETSTESAETEDGSAPSTETAAASEAATTQGKPKTAQTSENRYAKLSRENRELREKLARAEGRQEERDGQRQAQTGTEGDQHTAQPDKKTATAAPPKPKFNDVDDKGAPKYKTFAEFEDARDNWLLEEGARRTQASQTQAQTEQQRKATEQAIDRDWRAKVGEARKKHADFDTVALNVELPVKKGSPVDIFLLSRKSGTDVLYHLGKHPAELDRINAMTPIDQVAELTRIEISLTPTPAKKVSSAPPPVRTVTATSNAGRDEVETALKDDDVGGYIRSQNARDLARRRGN